MDKGLFPAVSRGLFAADCDWLLITFPTCKKEGKSKSQSVSLKTVYYIFFMSKVNWPSW